jgi:uncharacterized surface protein with fasciclin (FAS1) repeats
MQISFFALIAAVLSQSALDIVLASPDHKILAALAATVQPVVDLLKSQGPLTLFAPTDAAFAKLDKATLEAVQKDVALLQSVLSYHAIGGVAFDPKAAPAQSFPKTALGPALSVNVKDGGVTLAFGLGSSKVTGSVKATNGVVHVVDSVLVPPGSASDIATQAKLTSLINALTKTNLVEAVNGAKDVTIFAPTEKAFADLTAFAEKNKLVIDDALLAEVLKLHVVPGVVYSTDIVAAKNGVSAPALSKQPVSAKLKDGSVLVSGEGNATPAKVAIADVVYNNGVIHVIDAVLLPKLGAKEEKPKPKATTTAADYKPAPTKSAETYATNIVSGASAQGFALASVIAAFFVL